MIMTTTIVIKKNQDPRKLPPDCSGGKMLILSQRMSQCKLCAIFPYLKYQLSQSESLQCVMAVGRNYFV